MTHVQVPHPWNRRDPSGPPPIDEKAYFERRTLLAALGLGGAAIAFPGCARALGSGGADDGAQGRGSRWVPSWEPAGGRSLYPAKRNETFEGGRPITPPEKASTHNNFYEFLPDRAGPVYEYVGAFRPRPWTVRIAGAVEEEKTVDIDEIARIAPLEERVYRFRCVEAWSMVVPWTGIPMAAFVRWCKPESEARFLRFESFLRPEEAPGQREADYYSWPYYEGLRMDEALNPLTLLVTGIFGHGLPAQHGAPLRVIVPWKYGYKSPKSIVKVEFLKKQPGTFWSDRQPKEYPFLSNVEPQVPHPRWSQAKERDLATGDRIPTRLYNGYEEYVAELYS